MEIFVFEEFQVGIFKQIPSSEQTVQHGAERVEIGLQRRSPTCKYLRRIRPYILDAEGFDRPSGKTAVDQSKRSIVLVQNV